MNINLARACMWLFLLALAAVPSFVLGHAFASLLSGMPQ